DHHGTLAHAMVVCNRAQFELHLQGASGEREAGRPRARGALSARGQRAQSGNQGAYHGAANRQRDGRASLGGSLRRGLENIFDLQDQVTGSVVGGIGPKLEQAEIERARRKPTESLDAYDYFLRGMAAFNQWTEEANSEALSMFGRAIELDPKFASAYGMAA